MDQIFIAKMKESLLESKKQILDQLMATNADFKQIVEGMESKDVVDVAADDIDRKLLETMGTQDLNRVKLIDNALARIEQGKYGLCMKCGHKIPQERLEAIPYALMCIDCKSADEKRHR
ncbi:MAG: TraR/DksA family transcriptional regulator [Treponemataceae bacterium]|nr:TraR/DksA family transcriptional regulator [Treponemataceae bacterium]